jgi:hypothetical protein
MAYVDPKTVIAPKSLVKNVEVVYNSSEGDCREEGFSVVRLTYGEDRDAVGIRWNGDPDDKGIGTPQAFGQPTWFLIPDELRETILDEAHRLMSGKRDELKAGYSEMAKDEEREREAQEWSEGLIGDQARE